MLNPIVKKVEVPCSQKMAFEVFADINSWWPLDKRSMSMKDGKSAKSVSVDAKPGGQIIEHGDDGRDHLWGTIKDYNPHDLFSMYFHMGLPPCESLVEVTFRSLEADRTEVVLTQSNWEAFGDLADMMFNGYGGSWRLLFEEAYRDRCIQSAQT